jgi:hypothetical protein
MPALPPFVGWDAVTLRRFLAGAVVALAGVGVWPALGAAGASNASAQAWYREVLRDLRPLQTTLPGALEAASGWEGGSESAATARDEFAQDLPSLERVERTIADLKPLPAHASARADYAAAIELYVESLKVDQAATELTPGALQGQLQHSFERIRELGDNVFDQGTSELAPLIGATLAGDDVAAATHVPDWTALGLAPQPPLVSSWRASGSGPLRTQPKAAWEAEVEMDGAPTQANVTTALGKRLRPSQLAPIAVALGSADAYVSSIPAPAGAARPSSRLRLGLLVDAEAAMADEGAHLSDGTAANTLSAAATSLATIGGTLRAEG